MKKSYSYNDIIKLKLKVRGVVNKVKSDSNIDLSVKNNAIMLEPYVNEYDKLLISVGIMGVISDLETVKALNETSNLVDRIQEQLLK